MAIPNIVEEPAPDVSGFHDPDTGTITYVVADPHGSACAIVDPVLDYDAASGRTKTTGVDRALEHVEANELSVEWILETHVHADHLTAAPYVRDRLGGKVAISRHIRDVQSMWKEIFNAGDEFTPDGSQFDQLFGEGDSFQVGALEARVMETPGHTPGDLTYVIGDAAFVGDTLFMPDSGTARCDFPGGSAETLWNSIQRLLEMPGNTRLFMCHDYGGESRDYAWQTTVAEQRAHNIHVRDGMSKDDFVRTRTGRDATLSLPRLIVPSIQVNMRAGSFPPPEENGTVYLKTPVNRL